MTQNDKFDRFKSQFETLINESLKDGVPAFLVADVLAHTEFECRLANYNIQKQAQAAEVQKRKSPLILPPGINGN